jgi:hypothetical protein
MIIARAFDDHVDRLCGLVKRIHAALTDAGIEYRLAGGIAVFFHVNALDPLAARLTRDVDIAVERRDLDRITVAAKTFGYRSEGPDMLVDMQHPKATAVHLILVGEKVRAKDLSATPGFSEPTLTPEGYPLAPVSHLIQMKLNSFRFEDRAHIIDMDSVGLITPEIEAGLPEALRERLRQVRAEEAQAQ